MTNPANETEQRCDEVTASVEVIHDASAPRCEEEPNLKADIGGTDCRECRVRFSLNPDEAVWFREHGLCLPLRCRECRDRRREGSVWKHYAYAAWACRARTPEEAETIIRRQMRLSVSDGPDRFGPVVVGELPELLDRFSPRAITSAEYLNDTW